MTSPEITSVAKRQAMYGVISDKTALHSWSADHMGVRDLITRQLPEIPTIVRISEGYHGERRPHRFNFHEGSLYLVRSVRLQQLVVARTPDQNYVTIPRDSPLTFHLVSNDNTLATVAMTLADILGSGSESEDVGPCNGQGVQLSNTQRSDLATWIPAEVLGQQLQLNDIYKETFLVCHAFTGGTVSSKLMVIPGYLPLKLNVAQSMTSGADLGKYVSTLCQAVGDYSTENYYNDPHEIAMFTESPSNNERIEPCPAYHKQENSASQNRPDGVRFAVDSQISKRPLPPIPSDAADPQSEKIDGGLFRKQKNASVDPLKWQSRVKGTQSKPFRRAGSEPNLLEDDRQQGLSSSQSLEVLGTADSVDRQTENNRSIPEVKITFLSEDGVRSSPTKSTKTSLVLGRNAAYQPFNTAEVTSDSNDPEYMATPGYTNPALLATAAATAADATSANDVQKPRNIELRQTTALLPPVQYTDEEGVYDSILSPTYIAMIRSSGTSSVSTSRPTSANTATGLTDNHDGAVDINVNKTQLQTSLPERDRRPPVMSRQPEKPSSYQDEEDYYCLPYSHTSPLKDVERGPGVGAEEDRNQDGPLARAINTTGKPGGSVASGAPVPHPGSLQRIGFTSLDDVPTDLSCLSVVEVLQCLRWLNLHRYVDVFRAERIDGKLLMSLDQQVLVEELGLKRLEATKLEKFARNGWRPKVDSDSPNQHHLYYYQQQQQQLQLQFHSQNDQVFTDV